MKPVHLALRSGRQILLAIVIVACSYQAMTALQGGERDVGFLGTDGCRERPARL